MTWTGSSSTIHTVKDSLSNKEKSIYCARVKWGVLWGIK